MHLFLLTICIENLTLFHIRIGRCWRNYRNHIHRHHRRHHHHRLTHPLHQDAECVSDLDTMIAITRRTTKHAKGRERTRDRWVSSLERYVAGEMRDCQRNIPCTVSIRDEDTDIRYRHKPGGLTFASNEPITQELYRVGKRINPLPFFVIPISLHPLSCVKNNNNIVLWYGMVTQLWQCHIQWWSYLQLLKSSDVCLHLV